MEVSAFFFITFFFLNYDRVDLSIEILADAGHLAGNFHRSYSPGDLKGSSINFLTGITSCTEERSRSQLYIVNTVDDEHSLPLILADLGQLQKNNSVISSA